MKQVNIYKTNVIENNNKPKNIVQRQEETDSIELASTSKNIQSDKFTDLMKKFGNKIQSFISGIYNKTSSTAQTNYSSVYEGFEEYYFSAQDSIVENITLTDEQKEILSKKIEEFEEYKNSLSNAEKAELEKNKHSMSDFSLKNGEPDTNLSGYNEFLEKYEAYKNGDFTNITNEDLAQLLYYTDTTDLVSDGKIGSFAQGRTGDCWFLSMLGNYASTLEGEKNIADRISGPDADGNYTVTFNNPLDQSQQEEYIISAEELKNYDLSDENSSFSSGDLDVRILEIATDKMLNKYLNDDDSYDAGKSIREGYMEKKVLVHKALGYEDNIIQFCSKDDLSMIDFGYTTEEYINNTNAQVYSVEMEITEENGEIKITPKVTPTDYNSLSEIVFSSEYSASELNCGSGQKEYSDDEKENRYMSTGHAYNLMQINDTNEAVTVNDPYNSAFPHTISKEDFDSHFTNITYIPSK